MADVDGLSSPPTLEAGRQEARTGRRASPAETPASQGDMVRNLTNSIQFILETVRASTVVEVQGDRIRRRNDWMNWPSLASTSNPPHSSAMTDYDSLAARMRNVALDEGSNSKNSTGNMIHIEGVVRSLSGESNGQSSMTRCSAARYESPSNCEDPFLVGKRCNEWETEMII
ncbi:hypothetical protein Taro_023080 [Colocasia esculenta]|uniref:Uncharacterized protein n=1 Tax=Colocasia esculenta TaxID=4460 RepID=A0A843UWD5_COLES|nr:hypothetical protein [Colocasia esculenta]